MGSACCVLEVPYLAPRQGWKTQTEDQQTWSQTRLQRCTPMGSRVGSSAQCWRPQGELTFEVAAQFSSQLPATPKCHSPLALMGLAVLPFLSVCKFFVSFETRCLAFSLALNSASSCFSFQSPGITGTHHHAPPLRSLCAFAVPDGMSFVGLHLT